MEDVAGEIVKLIWEDADDRSMFNGIDDEIQDEIRDAWKAIVDAYLQARP